MAQTIMFSDCQPPFFSTKNKFQKVITALSLNSTHLKKQQVNKRMKINWLTFLFRKNMYNLWSLKIFSFCAVWRINTWEFLTLSLQLPFLDNSEDWWSLQCLSRKRIKLIKFLFHHFSLTYRIGSLYLTIRPYNVKKETHRKYIRDQTSFRANCPIETLSENKCLPA